MDQPDLSSLSISCAVQAILNVQTGIDCFKDAGFSDGCAAIWTYIVLATNVDCGPICTDQAFSGEPNNGPPPTCELAECFQCGEDNDGPVFKEFAGRTRRSSGLLSGLVRKCSELASVVHSDPCEINAAEDACEARKAIDEVIGEEYGTVCQCDTIEGQVKLTCVDTLCLGCNDELSVCAEFSFGNLFSANGEVESTFTQVDYIHGMLFDQILYSEDKQADGVCSVTVNGMECDECGIISCDAGFDGIAIQCSNVPGGEDFNSCDQNFSADGVFQFFNIGEFDKCITPGEVACQRDRIEEEVQFGPPTTFGTRCECSKIDEESILTCIDTTCKHCNDDESVCTQYGYGFMYFDGSFSLDSNFELFEYIEGGTEQQIALGYYTDTCSASVDGVECTGCEYVDCNAGEFVGREVQCSNVVGGTDFTECDLTSTDDSVFETLNFGPDCIERTSSAEEGCLEKSLGENSKCACTESDVPGSPLPGGRFELECDKGEVCHCNQELDDSIDVCVSHMSNQVFDPLYGSIAFIEDVATYTQGRSDEVRLEMTSCDGDDAGCPFGFTCSMKVNGEDCSSCELCSEYVGGFNEEGVVPGLSFDCSDIEEGATFDLCSDPPTFVLSGVFRFLSDDVCTDVPRDCGALFDQCEFSTDCCSGRCAHNKCRTAFRAADKDTFKLSGSHGGAGGAGGEGRKRHRVRGM
jgi:hypothetical protein